MSPYEMGRLAGFSENINALTSEVKAVDGNVPGIFYATAFQSGVEQFLVLPLDVSKARIPQFFHERLLMVDGKQFGRAFSVVNQVFSEQMPRDYDGDNSKYTAARQLNNFIPDVFVAMNSKSSLLNALGIPNINDLKTELPPSLYYPVHNLFSCIRRETVALPVSQLTITAENVKRYQDILAGGVFSDYSKAHEELENNPFSVKTLDNIVRKGRRVIANNQAFLTVRDISLGILSLTPKVIDTIFGKIPGMMSDALYTTFISRLTEKPNLLIYDFSQLFDELFKQNIKQYVAFRIAKGNFQKGPSN